MKFQYIGPDAAAPEQTVFFGLTFTKKGEPVDVTDTKALEKIKGNPSFVAVGGETKAPKAAPADGEVTIEQMKAALKEAGVSLRGLNAEAVAKKYAELIAA